MNKKLIKDIAIFICVPTVIAIGYFGVRYYRRKMNEPSKEQLDELIKAFSVRQPSDVFTGITQEIYDKIALPNFKNNVTKEEADEAILIGNKKDEEVTDDDKTKLLTVFPKILGSTNINAMGIEPDKMNDSSFLDKYAKNLTKLNQKNKSKWL